MALQTVSTEDNLKVWTEKTNIISTNIGELGDLVTTSKTNMVSAANELLATFVAGLKNVVQDTSPELGGNLVLNSKDITGTGNINIGTGVYTGGIGSTTTATTKAQSDNTTCVATTAFADAKIATLMGSTNWGGEVSGQAANLQIVANTIRPRNLNATENGGVEYLKTDGSGNLSFINTIGSGTGGDLSGAVSNLQIVANKVGITELNLSDGSVGHLATTNGSGTLTFKPSVTLSKVTTTANQTVFTISYIVNNIVVFLDGLKLIKGVDFTATNGTSVTLTTAVSAGRYVEFQRYGV